MRKPAYIALAALVVPFALGADVKCYPLAAPKSPWERMADPASIPTFRGDRALRFSSYDRGLLGETVFGPGNKDFNHFLAACGSAYELTLQTTDGLACEPGADGYLLAKVSGEPGYVSRLWFAKFPEDVYGEPWHDQRLVVFVDDLATPAVDIPVAEVAAGGTPPFVEPFAGKRSGGLASYAPIPFERELRVYLRGADNPADVVYYHVDVRLTDRPVAAYAPVPAPPETALRTEAAARLSALGTNPNAGLELVKDGAPTVVGPGADRTLFEDAGAGVVSDFRLAVPTAYAPLLSSLTLRMTWDGAEAPAVDVPLRSFFGLELEDTAYRSLFLGHVALDEGSILYSYLPMPFRAGARIAVSNASGAAVPLFVTVGLSRTLPEEPFGALHVVRHATDAPTETHHVIADVEQGRGVLAGLFLHIRGRADPGLLFPQPRNYLEGDERIVVDGATVLQGTGTEEVSDGAWYFRGPFDSPFSGALFARNVTAVVGESAQYRWWLPSDALAFHSSLHYDAEYALRRPELIERYVSTAYLYLLP